MSPKGQEVERRQKQKKDFNRFLENRKQLGYDRAGQRELRSKGIAKGIPVRSMLMGPTTLRSSDLEVQVTAKNVVRPERYRPENSQLKIIQPLTYPSQPNKYNLSLPSLSPTGRRQENFYLEKAMGDNQIPGICRATGIGKYVRNGKPKVEAERKQS